MNIPTIDFPVVDTFEINPLDEPLVSLSENGFICESQYYLQNIPGSLQDCLARKSVVELLKEAESKLPEGYRFKIYDAYRPIAVQQYLWDKYRNQIKMADLNISDKDLDDITSIFVSKPSYDINKPSIHNTGGSVDLTLVYKNMEVDMGTKFDDFTNKAWTSHFESANNRITNNRRILCEAMTSVGFTNLPSEWWHYDYGTKFWSYFKKQPALYVGIL